MCKSQKKYSLHIVLIFFGAFSCHYQAYSQERSKPDTIPGIAPVKYFHRATGSKTRDPFSPIAPVNLRNNKNLLFFDSLKVKASRKPITKKLYDIVVVTSQPVENKQITNSSDAVYKRFSGKRIANIEVIRRNVFGSNLDKQESDDTRKIDNVLNRTHINTNERIIRNNILFSVGDTISPLILSDNERILRELSFIDDARIIVVPVSDDEVNIVVITKDLYSLGVNYNYGGIKKGDLTIFEKNLFGIGHEFGIEMPFNSKLPDSPGIGWHYLVNNMWKSFINLNTYYLNGLGKITYGFNLSRDLISSTTKYAGGVSIKEMITTEDFDSMPIPHPLKYNIQDYWLLRSFLINRESVSRIIIGGRYTNNIVSDRPPIESESYYYLQNYRIFLGSAAFSIQKFYKTNLIYGYGRTEDIPYGSLFRITAGEEFNEFKKRTYIGADISMGKSIKELGYFYGSAALASFFNGNREEQGLLSLNLSYFSNLIPIDGFRLRNFVKIDYSRGLGRYTDEYLRFNTTNGFTGFRNDSIKGTQRITVSLESVLFSHANYNGFRFAFFGFTDLGFLANANKQLSNGYALYSIGLGLRIRNDNLLFNTLQIRLGYFPNPPLNSRISNFNVSGEQLLKPDNFNSGPPGIIPYR